MKCTLPMIRVGAGHSRDVTIATRDMVQLDTHWLGTRKLICLGNINRACPACLIDDARLHIYRAVHCGVTDRYHLLEITERSWLGIKMLTGEINRSTLQVGDKLALHRKTKTSPMRIEVTGTDDLWRVPANLSTLRAVAGLYNLPLPSMLAKAGPYFVGCAERMTHRLKAAITASEVGPLQT